MSLGQVLGITAAFLLSLIAFAALLKEPRDRDNAKPIEPIEVSLEEISLASEPSPKLQASEPAPEPIIELAPEPIIDKAGLEELELENQSDRIQELFNTTGKKLAFIETISYKSRVPWLKGRSAWISDYAAHFGTSRHFIARSLNGNRDYLKQDVAEGNKFNVFRSDYPVTFQLVIDMGRCKMWFYALTGEDKILLRTYRVSLGRPDSTKSSGFLTPLGKYQLGSKTATYKPDVMGHYKGQKTEMMQVFGTRWIPFEKEISNTTEPAKGLGLHGLPWSRNKKGELEQNISSLGKFESDGCIRLETDDIEELFAIVITKPTFVELVSDISESELFK